MGRQYIPTAQLTEDCDFLFEAQCSSSALILPFDRRGLKTLPQKKTKQQKRYTEGASMSVVSR